MLVVCFHQKIPTGLNFTTFAPGLNSRMLLLLEGIIINWYLSIVDMTYEHITLLIEWLQYGTVFLMKWRWLNRLDKLWA